MVNPGGAEKVQVCVLQLHLNKAHTWGIHPPNLFWMAPAPPRLSTKGSVGLCCHLVADWEKAAYPQVSEGVGPRWVGRSRPSRV